jgi:hypothetical protein
MLDGYPHRFRNTESWIEPNQAVSCGLEHSVPRSFGIIGSARQAP